MRKAFTLLELITAVCIIGIILALVMSAFVAAKSNADTAQCSSNLHQIGAALQLYTADYDSALPPITTVEFIGHHGKGPTRWRELLQIYLSKSAFPTCPAVQLPVSMERFKGSPSVSGYCYNGWLSSEVKIPRSETEQHVQYVGVAESILNFSALTVTAFDARAGIVARRAPDSGKAVFGIWAFDFTADIEAQPEGARRHSRGSNYLFADGHVHWFMPEKLKTGRRGDGIHPGFGL